MDDSMMSISSFEDDDNLISDGFSQSSAIMEVATRLEMETSETFVSNDSLANPSRLALFSAPINPKTLNSEPSSSSQFMIRSNLPETPKHSTHTHKRKKTARRCLSTDLNKFSDENLDDTMEEFKIPLLSGTPIKSLLSSIENTSFSSSSNNSQSPVEIDLTPEFNNSRKRKSTSGSNNRRTKSTRGPLKPSMRMNILTKGPFFPKSLSECMHASIKEAVQISCVDTNLIGDCSQHHILPLLQNSKHQDLKSITSHVVADLLQGQYTESIESFLIIDCRYPYEYQGGHIQSAINLYTQEHVLSNFLKDKSDEPQELEEANQNAKRKILIFHCEFSSERGPNLCRFLRNNDRMRNVYPKLFYPEIYLLEGGYKDFYTNYSQLCEPQTYLPMHDKDHESELRKFRAIVKTNRYDSKFSTFKKRF